jgi:phosphopantothenoylcysteine decarboxylase / phosphopantothenate---cysteine ligase
MFIIGVRETGGKPVRHCARLGRLTAEHTDGDRSLVDLHGIRAVVTAGGTAEPIDPVRVITNRSTGKMGLAIARVGQALGADIDLICTSSVQMGHPVPTTTVTTTDELREAVLSACQHADVLIMAAAVSDFRVARPAREKIKKSGQPLYVELVPVRDFTDELPRRLFVVGFAAETENVVGNARLKLGRKGYQLVCANDITQPGAGFGSDTNIVTILSAAGDLYPLPLMSKDNVARQLWTQIASRLPAWRASML